MPRPLDSSGQVSENDSALSFLRSEMGVLGNPQGVDGQDRGTTVTVDGEKVSTMDARIMARLEAQDKALQAPANQLRMPSDVGVADTETLFPTRARKNEGLPELLPGITEEKFSNGDVMEILLITNYFDMLKCVGQNDSESVLYVANGMGMIEGLKNELAQMFSNGAKK